MIEFHHKTYFVVNVVILLMSGYVRCYSQIPSTISGQVVDTSDQPIVGCNVFIKGTIEGGFSDMDGKFSFTTTCYGNVTLIASYIGFDQYEYSDSVSCMENLKIILKQRTQSIDEAVITASSFIFGRTGDKIKKLNSLDVVMTGSSNGDIYAALNSLPGSQKVGENGRLYVRGGDSDETQTYINRMHVLVPYTTNAENSVQRSRFSPFLFKGINFSLGGYNVEYGQALSSVLPMETTDVSIKDKFGVSLSPFSFNAGGTKSSGVRAISFNADYMNMFFYNKLFPDKYNWAKPYQKASVQVQYKADVGGRSIFKTYAGYDLTKFTQNVSGMSPRRLDMSENNFYVNSTITTNFADKSTFFIGTAYSFVNTKMTGALSSGDIYANKRHELHIKTSFDKTFGRIFRMSVGTESFLRKSLKEYSITKDIDSNGYDLSYYLLAAYQNFSLMPINHVLFNFSHRLEYLSSNKDYTYMPRLSVSYLPISCLQMSLIYGLFSQTPKDDVMAYDRFSLSQGLSRHMIASLSFKHPKIYLRIEPYYKKYSKLPLLRDGDYVSEGHGWSKGLDVYVESTLIPHFRTTVSYSLNDNRRLYMDYPELSVPQYSTKHNFSVSEKYFIAPVNTYIGVSYSYASGRPYHNPNLSGYMNSETKPYGSLDVNASILLGPRIIVYTSISNVLGRRNVYNYVYSGTPDSNGHYSGVPVVASRDRFVYLGIFLSISNSHAYEVSNF